MDISDWILVAQRGCTSLPDADPVELDPEKIGIILNFRDSKILGARLYQDGSYKVVQVENSIDGGRGIAISNYVVLNLKPGYNG